MLIDRDSLSEIGATLGRNKTRTFLTAFGIFWGTLMLALLWGGGQGMLRMLNANFEGFASNSAMMYTGRTTKPYKGYKKGMQWSFTTTDIMNIRRRFPEIEAVSPTINRYSQIKYLQKGTASKQQSSVQGVDPAFTKIMNPIITKGRFINDVDVAGAAKVCVVGEQLAASLFRGSEPLGKLIEIDNHSYRVVGVAKQRGNINFQSRLDESVVIPISTARQAYNMGEKVDMMMLLIKDGFSPGPMRDKVFATLRQNHPLHPDDKGCFWYWDVSEEFGKLTTVMTTVEMMLLFVGFSSLLAGIIGVGNIMWIVVKERTKEFGIRRAIGAKPMEIMAQILAESAILTVIAGMAAITASTGILALVTMAIRNNNGMNVPTEAINFMISFPSALTVLLLFIVLGSLAGTLPAIKAMRIKPIEALNDK